MTILFSSVEITPLNFKVFPPYGLITEAFIPLGTFLLLVGIFTSAINVSQDAQLRRNFRKSVMGQLNLLRTIGITEMEKELVKKFKYMEKRAILSGETEEAYREEVDVKEIVRDVLNELNKTKNKTRES